MQYLVHFRLLGCSGQNVDDIFRYSEETDILHILEQTLHWRHMFPTAPDTVGAYVCCVCMCSEVFVCVSHHPLTPLLTHPSHPLSPPAGCYPFTEEDPFIIESAPHVYFTANQPSYQHKRVDGGWVCTPPTAAGERVAMWPPALCSIVLGHYSGTSL